ncbi:glycosyltransferase [Paenibacillus gansuensis]|uniref:Glycosyltransferase n=1 Tax=Paenibacillus gansuensis TaxID=306542 RepID=A0ABW5PBZ2_9BACL
MAIIIYPPTIDWAWMKQRPQQLMKHFARCGHTVYYCNKNAKDVPEEEAEPNLYIVHDHDKWILHDWPSLRKSKKGEQVIVWCSFPKLADSLGIYGADRIIYDCVDEFAEWMPYEREMVRVAQGVTCTSERLYQRLSRLYPRKPLELVRNAYDPDMGLHLPGIRSLPRPVDLPEGPVVGYIGAWAPWVDQLLVLGLPKYVKGAQVAVIGPEFGSKYIQNRKDIHFLGLKRHEQLSAYLAHLSVCIIPFRINPITLSTNPVKAYEYLAAGKPVISTNLPECRLLQPYVDVTHTRSAFSELAAERISDPGPASERTQYALTQTWQHRVKQIEAFLTRLA